MKSDQNTNTVTTYKISPYSKHPFFFTGNVYFILFFGGGGGSVSHALLDMYLKTPCKYMKINCKVKWQVLTEEDTELHQKKASKKGVLEPHAKPMGELHQVTID